MNPKIQVDNKCSASGECYSWNWHGHSSCEYFQQDGLRPLGHCKFQYENDKENFQWFCGNEDAVLHAKLDDV